MLIEIFPDGYSYPMEYQQIAAALRVAPGGLASRVALPNALPQRLLAWLFRDLPEGLLSASWAGTLLNAPPHGPPDAGRRREHDARRCAVAPPTRANGAV